MRIQLVADCTMESGQCLTNQDIQEVVIKSRLEREDPVPKMLQPKEANCADRLI